MRWLGLMAVLPLLGAGCGGTLLSQLETGYANGPNSSGGMHGGSLAAHIGGSSVPGVGLGATVRASAWSGGWAFPEFGPHAFVLAENDTPLAFYSRLSLTGGLSGVGGDVGPIFTATLTPGIIIYPAEEAFGLTLSAVFAAHAAPVAEDTQLWIGFRLGVALGGVDN